MISTVGALISILVIAIVLTLVYIIYVLLNTKRKRNEINQKMLKNVQKESNIYKNDITTLKQLPFDPVYIPKGIELFMLNLSMIHNDYREIDTVPLEDRLIRIAKMRILRNAFNDYLHNIFISHCMKYSLNSANVNKHHKSMHCFYQSIFNEEKKSKNFDKFRNAVESLIIFINRLADEIKETFLEDLKIRENMNRLKSIAGCIIMNEMYSSVETECAGDLVMVLSGYDSTVCEIITILNDVNMEN